MVVEIDQALVLDVLLLLMTMATVWDGEITGMKLGLRAAGNTEQR